MRRFWPAFVVVLGISLWAQLFLSALLAEYRFADTRMLYLLAYVASLFVLMGGVGARHVVTLQFVFVASFLPGLLLLPVEDQIALGEGWGALWLCATLAVFMVLATSFDSPTGEPAGKALEARERGLAQDVAFDYRWYFGSRLAVVLFLYGVCVYAVFFDATILAHVAGNYVGSEAVAVSFLAVFMFFVWCMVVYLMVLVPTMNLEYDQRRLARTLEAVALKHTPSVAYARILGWIGVGIAVALALWLSGG
ncbi:MAG: hypothetical protein H0U74_16335 [Bradymonadaceae bacterium]|nr:hypothetical protein [Lujinxingiaceae bacterium]